MDKLNNLIQLNTKDNNTIEIEYEILRSNRKTYSIALKDDGTLCVRTPIYIHDKDVERILREKQAWITRKLCEQKERRQRLPAHSYTEKQRLALEKRYQEAAREYIPKRTAFYFSSYPSLFVNDYTHISIRSQKTRWGSCSSKGSLSFNWRLMLAPPAILDYVVVHELCHLTHMNHSKEFWQCVGTILPDYKERRNWLKTNGSELMLL